MSDLGKLCHKAGGESLAYKSGGDGRLIYKAVAVLKTLVTFSWDAAGRDLDICGYWLGCPDEKIGYSYSTARSHDVGAYHIEYSGDITQAGGAEWARLWMTPWSANPDERRFRVHFNFYGHDEEHPTSVCTVVANLPGVRTLVKHDQPCGTTLGRKATEDDPSCTVVFDASGRLLMIE